MKNLVLMSALFVFVCGSAFASMYDVIAQQTDTYESYYIPHDKKEFEEIELTALPDAVKQAVVRDDRQAEIELAERRVLENGDKIYRVTLQSPGPEKVTKTYHADGKKYKKDK